jgi:hypothetical protein
MSDDFNTIVSAIKRIERHVAHFNNGLITSTEMARAMSDEVIKIRMLPEYGSDGILSPLKD